MVKPHCFPRLTLFSMSTIFIKKSYIILIKDTHRKNTYSNKTWVFTESMNMVIWVVCALNQLFIRHCYTQIKFSKKRNKLVAKFRSFWQVHFVNPIPFVWTLAVDKADFYGNAFLIVVPSTGERYSDFL